MRAAMFPQQNLKRREAAFCWARRRFAPAKCRNALLLSSKSAKLSFSQEKLLTTHCHEPAHISHQWTCERERFASQGNEATRRIRSVAMIHRMTETEPQGSVNTTCPSTRTNVRFLSSLGRLVLSSMLDAKEQGAQRPEESTIIPFSESRYRSSDVGRAHLQTGEAHLFISAPSGDIAHYTLLRKVVRKHGICAHKVRHSCA